MLLRGWGRGRGGGGLGLFHNTHPSSTQKRKDTSKIYSEVVVVFFYIDKTWVFSSRH